MESSRASRAPGERVEFDSAAASLLGDAVDERPAEVVRTERDSLRRLGGSERSSAPGTFAGAGVSISMW